MDVIHIMAEAIPEEDLTGIWESIALVGALSLGAFAMTWRRKDKRSQPITHWAVLLASHGGLVIVLHTMQVITHLGGALVLTAMAERIIWDLSDSVAERIDSFAKRLHEDYDDAAIDDDDDQSIGVS